MKVFVSAERLVAVGSATHEPLLHEERVFGKRVVVNVAIHG